MFSSSSSAIALAILYISETVRNNFVQHTLYEVIRYKKKQDNLNVNKNRITAYDHILPDNNPAQRLVAEEEEEQRQKEAAQLKESRKLSGEAIQEKVETYIVESGMSLGDIAAKFNVTIDELKTTNANKLKRWGKSYNFV